MIVGGGRNRLRSEILFRTRRGAFTEFAAGFNFLLALQSLAQALGELVTLSIGGLLN